MRVEKTMRTNGALEDVDIKVTGSGGYVGTGLSPLAVGHVADLTPAEKCDTVRDEALVSALENLVTRAAGRITARDTSPTGEGTVPRLTFAEYDLAALETNLKTMIGGNPVIYPVLGLASEAGEVAGKIKKVWRDGFGRNSVATEGIKDELGDVLWYLAATAEALGITLESVARRNIEKLRKRMIEGKIKGSGDSR